MESILSSHNTLKRYGTNLIAKGVRKCISSLVPKSSGIICRMGYWSQIICPTIALAVAIKKRD